MGENKDANNDVVPSQPSSPSTGIFSSIFPPPSVVLGRNSSTNELMECLQKQKRSLDTPDDTTNKEGTKDCKSNTEKSTDRHEPLEPCPLSSSLHYGGQEDMYGNSSTNRNVTPYNNMKKNEGEDDPSGNSAASRGNWWQGSLYY